jgi:hypothetical protein
MTALTKPRRTREVSLKQILRVLKNAAVAHEGGMACIDTADGSLVPAAVSATLVPIGYFIDVGETGVTGDGTKTVKVRLFKEVIAWWYTNDTGTPITDAKFASVCYALDDQTVTGNATGKSKAGRVWGVDATKGVLVEPAIAAAGI